MNPKVVIEFGTQAGKEYEIPPQERKERVLLGRGPLCDIKLTDAQLSRHHCQFTYDGESLYVEDLGSTNGTKVNDDIIGQKTRLHDGNHVRVGSCRMVVVHKGGEPRKRAKPSFAMTEEERLAEQIASLEGKRFADVKVEEKIHEGQISSIYKARDLESDKIVALKLIRPDSGASTEQKNRFLRGAKYAALLRHPNFVRVYKCAKFHGVFYLLMEYLKGKDLTSFLQERGGPLELGEALHAISQILDALQAAYEHELLVRSVRPDAVMIGPEMKATIIDFELVDPLPKEGGEEVTRLLSGALEISYRFAAPELIAYPAASDQRCDVFGAGSTLYYMLTCIGPFPDAVPRDGIMQAFFRKARDPVSLNPEIPPNVADIITKALQQEPGDRYQTPGEMLAEVREALSSL